MASYIYFTFPLLNMITPVERYILYTLGEFCTQASQKLNDKPLELSISKAEFIATALKAKMTPKKERAVYKNLEALQAKKLIIYEEKNLKLTKKGRAEVCRINSELEPYLKIKETLKTENLLKYARKAQTTLLLKE